MDYVIGLSLQLSTLLFIILSYDIACQWFTHLKEQMKLWPDSIKIPGDQDSAIHPQATRTQPQKA